jgi:hydroxymethylglutaryl-CoA reductase
MDTSKLKRFYKKSFFEKIHALEEAGAISTEDAQLLREGGLDLSREIGDHMIENYIGNYSLPLGTALNFVIDGEEKLIPMAIEEPSVIAAASFAAKIIGSAGGFHTEITNRQMIGQVALKQVPDIERAMKRLSENEQEILQRANEAYPSIVKRGGGARKVVYRHLPADGQEGTPEFLVVHVHVDTQEAMGANMINTMMEGIAPFLEDLTNGTALMKILSNYATESLATAHCIIPPHKLKTASLSGEEVRDRIIEAAQFAWADPYRAVTNNKGIMNGVDALIVASGNDWRAIEAGAHAYASRSGQYRSLTKWFADEEGNLVGELTLPLPVGSVGGSIGIHPGAKFSHELMDQPDAKSLERMLVSVGLAQNFAAIRALVTEGIQKGHMGLHARSLAISAGAKGEQIEEVSEALKKAPHMNLQAAKDILGKMR